MIVAKLSPCWEQTVGEQTAPINIPSTSPFYHYHQASQHPRSWENVFFLKKEDMSMSMWQSFAVTQPWLSINLSIYLSIYVSISIHPSIHLSISIYLSIYLISYIHIIYTCIYMFIYICLYPYIPIKRSWSSRPHHLFGGASAHRAARAMIQIACSESSQPTGAISNIMVSQTKNMITYIQCGAPKIANCLTWFITPITMVYGTYNYSYWGL